MFSILQSHFLLHVYFCFCDINHSSGNVVSIQVKRSETALLGQVGVQTVGFILFSDALTYGASPILRELPFPWLRSS